MLIIENYSFKGALASTEFLKSHVTTDAYSRFSIRADGKLAWGSGSADYDAGLERTGIGSMKFSGNLNVGNDLSIGSNSFYVATTGTVTAGLWNATKISEAYGGTNQSTYTKGQILYASAANTLSVLNIGSEGQVLAVSASGVPAWTTAATGGGAVGGNPTQSIGLSVVNGSAETFMRSDAAPALSQTITPTWTGLHIFQAATTGTQAFGVRTAADAFHRLKFYGSGNIAFGPGDGDVDITLSREYSAPNLWLKSSGGFKATQLAIGDGYNDFVVGTNGYVTTGVWASTAITAPYGGTGQTAYSTGDLLYAGSINPTWLSKLSIGSEDNVLYVNSSGIPAWGNAFTPVWTARHEWSGSALAAFYGPSTSTPKVGFFVNNDSYHRVEIWAGGRIAWSSGALPSDAWIERESGGLTTQGNFRVGSILYVGSGSFAVQNSGTVSAGSWNASTITAAYGGTGQSSYSVGQILYASASTTLTKLSIGSEGQVLTVSAGGVPYWATPSGGGVSFAAPANKVSLSPNADGDSGTTTVLRSNCQFQLDVNIAPTWTNDHTWDSDNWCYWQGTAASTPKTLWRVSGKSYNQLTIYADGKHSWGSGDGTADLHLERTSETVNSITKTWAKLSGNSFVDGILRLGIGTASSSSEYTKALDIGNYTIVKLSCDWMGTDPDLPRYLCSISGGFHGRILILFYDNYDGHHMILQNEYTSGTNSYDRIICGGATTNTTVNDYGVWIFYYDANFVPHDSSGAGRWILMAANSSTELWS